MKGTVEFISPQEGMVAVRTENGGISVLELLGGYCPEVGDELSGELENLGGEEIWNLTQGENWNVFIQDIHGSREIAAKLMSPH